MHIVIVSEGYPYQNNPSFPFVQQLAYALSNEEHTITVIAPQSLTKSIVRNVPIMPNHSKDVSPEGKMIDVYRPYYISFSNAGNKALSFLSDYYFSRAISKTLSHIKNYDAVYCYFWHIGLLTAKVVHNTPLFVQASECEITVKPYLKKDKYLDKVVGVVCASRKNYNETVNNGLAKEEKCTIIVNGYRPDQFYQIDQQVARKQYGYPEDAFIVSFVGGFINRKGIKELSDALSRLGNVWSIFIGKGNIEPNCDKILFKGSVPHDSVVDLLNCSDVFVLPTKAEGCCNAIIEALGCGLPVISSNKSFNNEILDDTCSIRIDENNIEELANAIKKLQDDPKLKRELSLGAQLKASTLTIDIRGKKVSNYILENTGIY